MKRIKNLKELELELAVLESRKMHLQTGIKNDIESIKEGLRPLRIAGRVVSGFIKKDSSHNDVLARTLGLGAEKLTKNYLPENMSGGVRKVISFFVGNITSNLASSKTSPVAEVLGALIENFFNKKADDLSSQPKTT